MITVFSEQKSNRLQYTLEVLFKQVLKTDFRLLTDWEVFVQSDFPKINYSKRILEDSISIIPHNLLFEESITKQEIIVKNPEAFPQFFITDGKDIAFDLFAASFYLLSRYEEYSEYEKDAHGRFPAKASLAYREGFLHKPVVNVWCELLRGKITEKFSDFNLPKPNFKFISTIDVDMAFTYKNKGLKRTVGGAFRDLSELNFKAVAERFRVLGGLKKDPFDNFDYQENLHQKTGIEVLYFMLLGNPGKFDKNISPSNKDFVDIIRRMAKNHRIGIHPSYASNENSGLLEEEINRLEHFLEKPVELSRQHFLKLDIRKTYQNLLKHNIKEDHSMGYSEQTGFRAGICTPFTFFDLEKNKAIKLQIFPFAVMDVALNRFMKLNPKQAIEHIGVLMKEVKSVGGSFTSVFHNESLSETDNWKGWRQVYEKMLYLATGNDQLS